MKTVHVTIGRNRNDTHEPLSYEDWKAFRNYTLQKVDELATVHFVGSGFGEYENVPEDAYHVVASVPDAAVKALRYNLAILAYLYLQDSIALTVGDVEFVEASK